MPDTVMNYAAQLTGAASPGTTMAAAAHFYQQQVSTCIYSWPVQLARAPQWQLLPTSTNNRLVPVQLTGAASPDTTMAASAHLISFD